MTEQSLPPVGGSNPPVVMCDPTDEADFVTQYDCRWCYNPCPLCDDTGYYPSLFTNVRCWMCR